jgi:pimeloyl-ACP methyl ester carboxylesterase
MPDLLSKEHVFTIDEIIKDIRLALKREQLNVVVGISMGGLLAPHLAKQFPESKLILIGTAPYFKTNIPIYNFLVHLEVHDKKLLLVRLLRLTPRWLFRFVYKFFNKSDTLTNQDYQSRADENYNGAFRVPTNKIREVLELVTKTNNSKVLQEISNKTIIFAGGSDSMMPAQLSGEMNSLIKNSKLIISNRLHYDVFTKADDHYLDEFLN